MGARSGSSKRACTLEEHKMSHWVWKEQLYLLFIFSFVNFYFLSVSIISIIMSMSIYKVHNVYVVLHDYNL